MVCVSSLLVHVSELVCVGACVCTHAHIRTYVHMYIYVHARTTYMYFFRLLGLGIAVSPEAVEYPQHHLGPEVAAVAQYNY